MSVRLRLLPLFAVASFWPARLFAQHSWMQPESAYEVVGGAGFLAVAIALGWVWWLRRRSLRREKEARLVAERLRHFYEEAPVLILEEDFSKAAAWLESARRAGVTDIRARLAQAADEVDALFARLRVVSMNRKVLKNAGVETFEDYHAYIVRHATPEVKAAFREELVAMWEGRNAFQAEIVTRPPDGPSTCYAMHWAVPVHQGRPDYTRVLLVFTDITPLRHAEARLRRSEDRWELAVRGINAGIWERDHVAGTSFFSERSREMLGYGQGDIGDSADEWEALVHPEDRAANAEAVAGYLAGRRPDYRVEVRLRGKDGGYRWVLVRGQAQFDPEGRPLRFVGTHTDITERKAVDQALAAERERLRVTLGAMAEGVITTDAQGVVRYLNAAATMLTGWAEADAVGRRLSEVCPLVHPRMMTPIATLKDQALQQGEAFELPPATALLRQEGESLLVDGRAAPIRDNQGRTQGMVLVLHDVTERARFETEMQRAAKLESIGILAGGIAHDFNNILTVVMGNLTIAMLDQQVMSAAGTWLVQAERGLVRAKDLTQQLLAFAKGGELVRTTLRLSEVVRDAAVFSCHGSPVRCGFDFDPELWAADVDKGQIGQVVQNLVINAVQAMPNGGRIDIRLANDPSPPERSGLRGPCVLMSVRDTGAGIGRENIDKIFDPYFTTKETGSGLGLATVYAIVRRHEGYIDVESEPGQGTCFRVWLPARPAAVVTEPAPAEPAPQKSPGRVLFMDDEESIRIMAKTLIGRLGFEVVVTADGEEALDSYVRAMAEGRKFDLVITDLTVPGGSGGLELMRELVKVDPAARVLVSSGYSSNPVMQDHRVHGFRGMLPKPYRMTELAKAIRAALEDN